jgi:hypothetical protein
VPHGLALNTSDISASEAARTITPSRVRDIAEVGAGYARFRYFARYTVVA